MIANTIVDYLLRAVNTAPEAVIFTYLEDGDAVEQTLTVRDLHKRATAVARVLNDRGLRNSPVLLLMHSGLEFIVGFVSCLYAGALAATAYPPRRRSEARFRTILRDSGAKAVLSTESLRQSNLDDTLTWICLDSIEPDENAAVCWKLPRPSDIAFLQYTSGSTDNPRGVIVRHDNLVSNLRMIFESVGKPEEWRMVSWLPMHHDMGLIGGVLMPIYRVQPAIFLSPFHFLQQPLRWLRAISRFGATGSVSPNFGYDLCSRRATPEDVRQLDLSRWTLALNGAEPVSCRVLNRFAEVFAPAGFRQSSFCPCYGLAEATLLVSGGQSPEGPKRVVADPEALAAGRVEPVRSGEGRLVVSCGRIHPFQDVRIVNIENLTEAGAEQVGEIWVAGPNVAMGYWQRPEESRASFEGRLTDSSAGPFLRTGDLGFRRAGELYVCGRLKDLIILRGRNIDPLDIEETVRRLDDGHAAREVAAFQSEGELVIACEAKPGQTQQEYEQLAERIRASIVVEHSVRPASVVLLRTGRLPKTTSGKVQRHAARRMFEAEEQELFRSTVNVEPGKTGEMDAPAAPWTADSGATRESERQHLMRWMSSRVAVRLGLAPDAILDFRAPLTALGLDSVSLVELSGELERHLGEKISPSLLYSYPSIEGLASVLLADLEASPAAVSAPPQGPIAVIGMACRFPGGADSPEEYWKLLLAGHDGVRELEAARGTVPDEFSHLTPLARRMGSIENSSAFDPDFFGIAEREACCMDPQHRLLLLAAWQALEHASIDPSRLRGRAVGVFCGLSSGDHPQVVREAGGVNLGPAAALGAAPSMAAGRISYQFGLRGPSLTLDTACSSSLLAVHLACQSLRSGESELALAGGANVIQSSENTVALWSLGALSTSGRCSAFSADADGYVRGEGAGMVVLKPLERALEDGDPILAVIHGSAANHDGESNGLTAPSGIAQRALIQEALVRASVEPGAVGFVEAHGTGTPLGDPIEADALRAAFRLGETKTQLLIGSCKTNLGHLEAAAGIAGLSKVVLALQHGIVPPNLHFTAPNPGVEWDGLSVPMQPLPWPAGKPFAGVSSFGLSGTNVHLVLGPTPVVNPPIAGGSADLETEYALPLSARTHAELTQFAHAVVDRLEQEPGISLTDVATGLVHGRRKFDVRATVAVLATPAEARAKALSALRCLSAAQEGERVSGLVQGQVSARDRGVLFLFAGQGAQRAGAGRELYERWPAFREVIDRFHELLEKEEGFLLRPLLFGDGAAAGLSINDTRYTQPALFALEVALSALWASFGIRPCAVLGHSVGEIAAASIAGVMSEADGLRMAGLRGRLMAAAPGEGAMLSVGASAAEVEDLIRQVLAATPGPLAIACYNAASQQTVAGTVPAIEALAACLERLHIGAIRLRVSHAFHSDLMKPVSAQFGAALAAIELRPPRIPFLSSLDGDVVGQRIATRQYWQDQLCSPVRFQAAVEAARRVLPDTNCWIELGPDPVLAGLVRSIANGAAPMCIPSIRSRRAERLSFLDAAASVDVIAGVDLSPLYPPTRRKAGIFPSYPFHLRTCTLPGSSGPPIPDIHYQVKWERYVAPQATRSNENLTCVIGGSPRQRESACTALMRHGISSISSEQPPALDQLPAEVLWLDGLITREPERMLADLAEAIQVLPAKVRVVTQGAVAVGPVTQPDATSLWGFGRSVALEQPERWAGLIDLDSDSECGWDALARWYATDSNEDQAALRGNSVYVPRLVPHSLPNATWQPPSGAALLIGGMGRIGLQLAEWLIGKGVSHIILTTTRHLRGPMPHERLAQLGATIEVERVDLADPSTVAKLFARLDASGVRLGSVFQLAGVCERRAAADVGIDEFRRALTPKLAGSRLLQEHLRALVPVQCVAFTSVAGVWGSAELAAYAAVNAGLDAWTMTEENAPIWQSIAWGPWLDSGMVTEEERSWLERMGLRSLASAQAFAALDRVLSSRVPGAIVADLERPRFCAALQARRELPLLAKLECKPEKVSTAPWVAELHTLAPAVQRVRLIERLRAELARLLSLDGGHAIDSKRGFQEQGVDSLMAAELRTWIERSLGRTIPGTLLFDTPNLESLTDRLLTMLDEVPGYSVSTDAPAAVNPDEPIAIVGMGCRFPGGANDPAGFWTLITEKKEALGRIPPERWGGASSGESDGAPVPRYGSFIEDVDQFDAAFFRISPDEARTLDPQQRLVLETTWHALEDAGIPPGSLRGSRTGAFIGIGVGDYQRLIERSGCEVDRHVGSGTNFCFSAGRLSHTLGLEGPSMAVDTACSSALMAVHLACQSLRQGESNLALAGGVNLLLTGDAWLFLSKASALAKDGRSKTFSAAADGYGRGEGCGMLVLKRHSDAHADGDHILAVIRSTAVNHDGASGGLTVPNVTAQRKLLTQALQHADASADQVAYLEAHGTGTRLGDPIELAAAAETYQLDTRVGTPLYVGSVKTNIGHLEAAGGAAGLIKVVLALNHRVIPGHRIFGELNPEVPWHRWNLEVAATEKVWPEDRPLAGVSAFGLSGTNVHVLLGPPQVPNARLMPPPRGAEPWRSILLLSAGSGDSLDQLAARWAHWLSSPNRPEWTSICAAAATRRSHLARRMAALRRPATSTDEIVGKLRAGASRSKGLTDIRVGKWSEAAPPRTLLVITDGILPYEVVARLAAVSERFRETFTRCLAAYREERPDHSPEEIPEATQGLLRVLPLVELWKSWGLAPIYVFAQGAMELAAACASGALSAEHAARRRAVLDQQRDAGTVKGAEADALKQVLRMETGPEIVFHLGPASPWVADILAGEAESLPLVDCTFPADTDPADQIALALATYHVEGGSIDWAAVHGGSRAYPDLNEPLPLYPFERRRHWIEASELFGAPVTLPMGRERHFSGELSVAKFPFLVDHKVYGRVVVPGAFHVAAMLTAARKLHEAGELVLENLLFRHAVVFDGAERYDYHLVASEQENGSFRLAIYVRLSAASEYRAVAEGTLRSRGASEATPALDWDDEQLESVAHTDFYEACAQHALDFGPHFRWLQDLQRRKGRAAARLEPAGEIDESAKFVAPPTLIDACFQLLALTQQSGDADGIGAAYVPFAIERLVLHGAASEGLAARALLRSTGAAGSEIADTFSINACVRNSAGEPYLSVLGLFAKRALEDRVLRKTPEVLHSLHEVRWFEIEGRALAGSSEQHTVLLGPESELLAGCSAMDYQHGITASSPEQLVHIPAWRGGESLAVVFIADRQNLMQDATLPARVTALLSCVADACASRSPMARLVVVTRGAIDFENSRGAAPELAALSGMARALATEAGSLGCSRIDLDPNVTPRIAAQSLAPALSVARQQAETAWRGGRVFAPRVERVAMTRRSNTTSAPGGTAIVTGGFGALGSVAARALTRSGYSHIVLFGRRLPTETPTIGTAKIIHEAVDIADRAQLEEALSRFRTEMPPIRAIVHAAGVRDDAPFGEFDAPRIQSVFAGKVTGVVYLDELTAGDPVEIFLAFGSASAWFPNPGQAPYVAANAALEALMAVRRMHGKPGICLQWGPWTTGMASDLVKSWERVGIAPFEPEVGQALIEQFLTERSGFPMAPLLLQTTGRTPISMRETSRLTPAAQDRAFRDELLAMPASARKRAVLRYLQRTVASMMGLPSNELPAIHTGLTELGLDSLMAVDLRSRLQPVVGRELSAAVVLEHPTLDLLAAFLVEQLPSPDRRGSNDGLNGIADHDLMRMLSAELERKQA